MGLASAMTAVLAAVAFCAATLNVWLHFVRREPEHLYLAVASLGVVMLSGSMVAGYEATSPEAVHLAEQLSLTSVIPLLLGFLRFSVHFLGVPLPRLERPAQVLSLVTVVGCWTAPQLFYTDQIVERPLAWLGESYLEATPTLATKLLFPACLVIFVGVIRAFSRHATLGRGDRNAVLASLCLWFGTACHDTAIVVGVLPGPYLIGLGYGSFCLVFTGVLLRRFARALEHEEENAGILNRLVEEQTRELRRRELAMAHGERMATLGTLAAGVAHEINNPIAFVSSNLNHLAEAWKQGEREPVEEILAETREGIDRIRHIVVELLNLARRGDGSNEPVDLNRVVRSVLPLLRHQAESRAKLETQLMDVPPVIGDASMLGQVVLNLALNSLHAMDPGDPARARVTISTAYEDGSVWLVVRDTGAGIPEDVLPHIFDPFFTTKEQGKGTGLGLAVTHQIVTRHRGRIDVETGSDGTTITVELPRAGGAAGVRPAPGPG